MRVPVKSIMDIRCEATFLVSEPKGTGIVLRATDELYSLSLLSICVVPSREIFVLCAILVKLHAVTVKFCFNKETVLIHQFYYLQ